MGLTLPTLDVDNEFPTTDAINLLSNENSKFLKIFILLTGWIIVSQESIISMQWKLKSSFWFYCISYPCIFKGEF